MIIKKKKDNSNSNNELSSNNKEVAIEEKVDQVEEKKENAFLLDHLSDVKERQERRRGDRRRGYRRTEDRSLVSRAHEEAKIIKENAQKEGFDEGVNSAKEEVEQLKDAIKSIIDVKEKAYEYYKNDIAFIAIEVAKKVVAEEIKLSPETVIEIATKIIKNLSKEENSIVITVNPGDEQIMRNAVSEGLISNNPNVRISVSVNDSVEQGSCMVQTQSGQIDARFSSQFSIIKKAFEEGF